MGELFGQLLQGVFPANLQGEGGAVQHGGGHGSLGQGLPGQNLQLCLTAGQQIELVQTLLLPGTGNHGGVVQRQLPAGEHRGGFGQECRELLLEPLGGHVILTDDHDGAVKFPAQTRDQVAAVDLTQPGDGGGFLAA